MIGKEKRMSRILLLQGLGYIGILFGIIITNSGAESRNYHNSNILILFGISIIVISSIIILISMIAHVRIGRDWGNKKQAIFGLIGSMTGLFLVFFLWLFLMITYGMYFKSVIALYLIIHGLILFSLGLPILKLGGKPFIIASISVSLFFFIFGCLLDSFYSIFWIMLSYLFPALIMAIGCLKCRREIRNSVSSSKLVKWNPLSFKRGKSYRKLNQGKQ